MGEGGLQFVDRLAGDPGGQHAVEADEGVVEALQPPHALLDAQARLQRLLHRAEPRQRRQVPIRLMLHSRDFTMFGLLFLMAANPPGDWREFRGPDGTGHYAGPKIITEWGVDKNVAWKVPVPGRGWSSPIIVGSKIIL